MDHPVSVIPGDLLHVSVLGRHGVVLEDAADDGLVRVVLVHAAAGAPGLQLAATHFDEPPRDLPLPLALGRIRELPLAALGARAGRLSNRALAEVFREAIRRDVAAYARHHLARAPFLPDETPIPASGKVLDAADLAHLVDASLDGWLTTGRFNDAFEARLAAFLGVRRALTTNSGSSANLLALSALTSPALGERALRPGDEVIGVAAGFPTTVNPVLQNGLVPVLLDVELGTYNVRVEQIEAAITPRTRGIMLAHTLGNPFDLDAILHLKQKYGLWLVEDCCDALGSTWQGRRVGSFGDLGTLSFYPAHHITMGEGGAVFTNDPELARIVESFRDWGRDCYCPPGRENTCGKRFGRQVGALPLGYDHKYVYSHAGYNLKITDMQAAVGLSQLDKAEEFIAARKRNFAHLRARLASVEEFVILPEATAGSDPSWFGFPMTLRENAGVQRVDLLTYLDQYRIGTRLLFAGNLTRQPYFQGVKYRAPQPLENTDAVMERTFWVGVHPGLTAEMLDYVGERIEVFFGVGF
jgi:CDP-6-deoxy-D-xylo-4-hexulose-3-dehydrase